jgi:hypothetical protein
MNNNQRTYTISNEQLLLIDILNTMYNDNLRQITNLTDSNQQIRNLIIQILNTNYTQRRNNTNNNYNVYRNNIPRNTYRDNNTSSGNLGRVYFNNTPYIIDSVEQIRIPTNNTRNLNLNNNNDFSRILQSFFDPVEVYPTQSQIETATRRVRYCDIISPKNTSCPISLTNFTDNDMVTVIRHCGHIFNTDELNTWFRSHCNCPVCRYDIREDNSNASSVFNSENNNSINNSSTSSTNSNNQSNNNSSNSSEERNYTSALVNILFNGIMNDEYRFSEDFMNNLNNIDPSGNQSSQSFLNLLNTFNRRSSR